MPITRKKKEEVLEKLGSELKKATTVVFANFHKLTSKDTEEVRKGLRAKGVSYVVAKKTLAKRALSEGSYKGELPSLDGELAIVYGQDQIAPAEAVAEFEKKFEKRISILGGIFGSEFKGRDAMKEIASIPPREVSLAKIAFLLKSPIQRLAIAVNEVAKAKV
jgi:large subunit ribosomal protein L10